MAFSLAYTAVPSDRPSDWPGRGCAETNVPYRPWADLQAVPPDPRLLRAIPAGVLLAANAVPWRRDRGGVIFAGTAPAALSDLARAAEAFGLSDADGCRFVDADPDATAAALRLVEEAQARAAACRVRADESCRDFGAPGPAAALMAGLALIAAAAWPVAAAALVLSVAAVFLAATTALRLLAAFFATAPVEEARAIPMVPPVISVLIPLFREGDVTRRLLARLTRLDYPRDSLDIRLVVEAGDAVTAQALDGIRLPHWITVVRVPPGPVQTKPRAMNHALDGCRGEIVGIWDAEDAPAPDQLRRVAERFAAAPADLACLQGRLRLDPTGRGWLAQCFALEYAVWFGLILPGLARMGLPVPLGGTTVFIRRHALEAVGGWDAHNVTEDADLGIRLYRHGWRTDLVDTETVEEPTQRPVAWVRQRSRWLKGYAVTWWVHARRPSRLVADLGVRGALGVHVLFLGALAQFTLAPFLWLFWTAAAGASVLPLPASALWAFTGLFLLSEATGLALYALAARRTGRLSRALLGPTMLIYFPLATLAAWKALIELAVAPFYWDKTDHD